MALVQQKIAMLQSFINKNPAGRNTPLMIVAGRATSPIQALSMLKSGRNVQAVISQLAQLGVDPPEDYALAIARLQDKLNLPGPKPKIYAINKGLGQVVGEGMTIQEAIRHIEADDEIGKQLVQSYRGLKVEIANRMGR